MTFALENMTFDVDSRPRHSVFSKIEHLVRLMQDPRDGIPLRNKKNHFASTPSGCFTGNEFIAWLTTHFNDPSFDPEEALHLATLLCMHGYVYPNDMRSFIVRDDKSLLYRFQVPIYWPSNNLKLNNESYFIYLLKRSKRNKKKHGLEEYEQNALSKLQIVFCDKMGFVNIQAEEQVKKVKAMTRDNKILHDQQERVFWKVHRPPPNQVRYLEEGPSRYFQPSQMLARKKSNKDLKHKEVVYLRKAVEKPRMKFSKSVDLFLLHNEQYLSYDPLLDPQAAQPSNPWVSSDETLWDVNRDNVEIPTVLRIKKWALSFEDLLKDGTGRKEFEMFLKKEYSQENIHFYKACKELILCPNSKVEKWKTDIERGYLKAGATHEVNIDCKTMEVVRQRLKEPPSNLNASRYIFQPAMDHVYALMKKDSYTRFLRSDQYKALMEKAQNHPKKKFFSFGSNRKKTPSPQVQRRGSSSSDKGTEGELGGPGYHSFSTGNLRDLDDKPKRTLRDSNIGSDSSIYVGTHEGQVNQSPSMRRKEDPDRNSANKEKEGRRRSNLDVPRTGFTAAGTPTEINRKSDTLSPCLALNVPRTNIVTPWEGGS